MMVEDRSEPRGAKASYPQQARANRPAAKQLGSICQISRYSHLSSSPWGLYLNRDRLCGRQVSLMIRVVLAQPRGFCAGVVRAIDIVDQALIQFGQPVYVRHEIVHNRHVVDDLKSKGAIFVEELSEIPDGAVTVFSAHGVSRSVVEEAKRRNPAGARRHLPAGLQGASPGAALCRAGPHPDPYRPRRPSPRWRAPWARSPARCTWSRTRKTCWPSICRSTPPSPMSPRPPSASTTPRM